MSDRSQARRVGSLNDGSWPRRSVPDLPEGTGQQFIEGSYDCITFLGE